MNKLIKKILTSICALVLCVLCFTGCSLLEIDKKDYYDELVATVGDKEFTKKHLTDAFNTYGYQYYQNGYTLEESVKETLKAMIERELLLDAIKANPAYELSGPEKLEIKKQAFDYMQDSINSYADKVRKEWDLEIKFEEVTSEESLRDAETEYKPSTTYENGVVSRVEEEKDFVITDNLPEHFTKEYQIITDEKVCREAWTRYIKALQDAAKSEGRETSEEKVLLYEEERLIELLSNNKYLEKFEDDFFASVEVNTGAVLNYFREQYKSQREIYENDESAYHTAMKDSSKNYIYYHVNSGNEYVNVKHILLNFNDVQKELITALNTEYEEKYQNIKDEDGEVVDYTTDKEYQAKLYEIAYNSEVKRDYELDGELIQWNANQVIDYVNENVTGSFREKSSKFDDLIYIFNDDPGIMNSEFDYVVNLDTSVTDQMVKPFADGVRALDESNGGNGAGSMSAVITEYGIHILFHDGVAENLVGSNDIDTMSDDQLLSILCTTMTTPDSNKSIFNYIYDSLSLDANLYNNKTAITIESIKTDLANKGIVITYYEKAYEDLWK